MAGILGYGLLLRNFPRKKYKKIYTGFMHSRWKTARKGGKSNSDYGNLSSGQDNLSSFHRNLSSDGSNLGSFYDSLSSICGNVNPNIGNLHSD